MTKERKIKAVFIFEMLGRPSEYLKSSMEEFIVKIGEIKGVEIISKKIHDPKPIEKEGIKDFFTNFSEVEVAVDNLLLVFDITLNMLPSHVEILEPSELELRNFDLGSVLSNLAAKLHRYDEVAKTLILERNQLLNKLKEVQEGRKENESKKEDINTKKSKKNSEKENKSKKKEKIN
jgi:hypothetical protein